MLFLHEFLSHICNQVEYQLSDTNLVASDFLIQIMNKDPEGYGKRIKPSNSMIIFSFQS